MNMQRSCFSVAKEYQELSNKRRHTKKERETLWELRRTLEAHGINPHSNNLIDLAIVADNDKAVKKFVMRATDADMHYARKYFGDAAGKVKANALGAHELKQLGLSTADPKKLASMMNIISSKKRAVDKRKSARDRKRFAAEVVNEEVLDNIIDIEKIEIIDEYNEKDKYSPELIADVNAYAEGAFLPGKTRKKATA